MKGQMDRAHCKLRPNLKRSIRRFELSDYNQLTLLATEVERTTKLDRGERLPPSPKNPFFAHLAYAINSRLLVELVKLPVAPHRAVPTTLSNL